MRSSFMVRARQAGLTCTALAALLVGCGGGGKGTDAGISAAPAKRALAAAQNPSGWVAVNQPNDVLMQNLSIPADAATRGMWSGVGPWPMLGVHQAVLPDGRVLTWGTTPDGGLQNGRYFDLWDPNRGLFDAGAHNLTYDPARQDSFCAPSVFLGNGRLMITGGVGDSSGKTNQVYNPASNSFERAADLSSGRWYGTMVTMSDGRVTMVGGIVPFTEGQWNDVAGALARGESSMTAEIYENGAWRTLMGTTSRTAFGPDFLRASLPKAWLAPDGRVFGIGTDQMYYVDANAAGGVGATTIVGGFKTPPQNVGADQAPNTGPSMSGVMYAPGQVMAVGGNNYHNGLGWSGSRMATSIDINGGGARLKELPPLANPRTFANTIVLPDGRVLVTGGETKASNDPAFAVYPAEAWDPVRNTWSTWASAAVFRGYHSQTSLLTNGTVLSTGGGNPGPVQLKGEVFYPPYLFRSVGGAAQLAPRPQLVGISGLKHNHGAQMQFDLSNSNPITQVVLIGLSTGTHSFNAGQRRIPLPYSQDKFRITAVMPDANLAPPGYYQLIALDASGVPSLGSVVAVGASVNVPPVATAPYSPPDTGTPAGTPPSNAATCANEAAVCNLPAGNTATVWYGAGAAWFQRTGVTGSISCDNATFGGDPALTIAKSCRYVVGAPPPPPPTTSAPVCFHADVDYEGASFCISSSSERLSAEWNDSISSVRLPAGTRVELFSDAGFGGSSLALTADEPNLVLRGFNDAVSSIRITRSGGNPPPPPSSLPAVGGAPQFNAPLIRAGGTATYSVAATAGVTYSWSFSDGSPDTAFSATASTTKVFANPGTYAVTLTARSASGSISSRTTLQAVASAALSGRASASSAMALEARPSASARLWVANPDNNSVAVIDTATNSRVAEIAVGGSPRSVAIAPDGRVWVTNKDAATISLLSPSTLAVVGTVNLPRASQPHGLVFADGGSAFVVLEATGRLLKLDPTTAATQATLAVGANPRHVSATPSGALVLVSRFITNPLPGEATASVDTSAAGAEVIAVNAGPMTLNKTIVLRHSDKVDSENQGAGIPNYLAAAVVSPDGARAWVPSKQDNIRRGTRRNGQGLDFQNSVRAISSRIDMAALAEDYAARIDHDNSSLGTAAAYHPSGAYLFVALETSRQLVVVDPVRARELLKVDVGRAPQAISVSADGNRLYVQNFMDRTVSVLDLGPLLTQGQLNLPTLATVGTVGTEKLAANVLQGKQFFYDARDRRLARDSYLSCAACHSDAGHDGRTWDFTGFGEGLRNTPALTGRAGIGQGFVHWSANFDEIQDLEGQIRSFAGGTGLMSDAQFNTGTRNQPLGDRKSGVSAELDALSAYLGSLNSFERSPNRNPDGTLTAAAAAGKTVFTNAGCASCHGGGGFTTSAGGSQLKNIGTIKPTSGQRLGAALNGLDVPTLRDVWKTAPYLHDGSAPTLAAAVQAHQGNTVAGADLSNLVAYLQQLGSEEAAAGAPPPPAPPQTSQPPTTAAACATENGTCTIPAGTTATVYYGAGNTWAVRTGVTGSIGCSNTVFGDPAPTIGKSCRYQATGTAPPPPPPPPPPSAKGTGLTAQYFNNASLNGTAVLTRVEAPSFNWGTSAPAAGVPADNFSVRWVGQLQAVEAGVYQLRTNSDDGVRVWIDGFQVVNNWTPHAAALDTTGPFTLAAGQRVPITIEYFERAGAAVMQFSWLRPGGTWTPVPAAQLLASSGLPANALAEWTFDTAAGTTALDSSGNGRTLTLGSGVTVNPAGKRGNALRFAGPDSPSGASTAAAVLNTAGSFSVAGFIRFDQLPECWNQVMASQDGTTVSGFFLGIAPPCNGSTARATFAMMPADADAGPSYRIDDTTPVVAGTWYHLVAVRDAAANTMALYVNGRLAGTTTNPTKWTASGALVLGRSKFSSAMRDHAYASVDGVRAYGRALTAAEVQSLFAGDR